MTSRLVAAVLLLLSAACGGGASTPSTPPQPSAVALAFLVPPGASSAVAPLAAVKVELRDAAGALVSGATSTVTLSLAPGAGGAVLEGTTSRAAVAGVATFADLRVARAGTGYQLAAASTDLTGATSAAFDVAPGPPSTLALLSQPADGRTGVPLAPALQVSVKDAAGNPVDDAQVTASLVPGAAGGTLTGTATTSPVAGVASFPDLAVGGAGAHALRIEALGAVAVTTAAFSLTDAWTAVGPEGGQVTVAADPVAPLQALAGGVPGGGLWRTTDGGSHWTPVAALRGRTVTPTFLAAGVAWAYGDSLWHSTDGGIAWLESPSLALSQDGYVAGVARDPATQLTYVAVSDYESRLLASADGGATLAPVTPAPAAGARLLEVATGPGGLYLLTSQGFQALKHGAQAWTAPVAVDTNPYRLLAHPTDPLVLFAAGFFGLHRSVDGGATWATVVPIGCLDLWIDPAKPASVVAVTSADLKRSADGGATFPDSAGPPGNSLASLSGTAARLYVGADNGPWSSVDGGASWSAATGGLRARRITAVAVSAGAGPVVLAGTDHGELYRSADGGSTFASVGSARGFEGRQLVFDPVKPGRAYFLNGYLMASDDAGASWTAMTSAPPGALHLAICRQVPATLWVSDQNATGVWRSTDGGATWTRAFTRPDANFSVGQAAADAVDPKVATFAAIDFASGSARTGLWQTRDAGATWKKLAEPFYGYMMEGGPEAGAFWAFASSTLKRTGDLGATFSTVTPPMGQYGSALALDPADPARLAVGTGRAFAWIPGDGVWLTGDAGATWAQSRSGHDLFGTAALAFDPGDKRTIYAGTFGGGLLKTTSGGF